MTFSDKLELYEFNRDTILMMKNEGGDMNEIYEMMETADFSRQLVDFILNIKPAIYNSIMLRLKFLANKGRSSDEIKASLKMFKNSYHVIDYLFDNKEVSFSSEEKPVEKKKSPKKNKKKVEIEPEPEPEPEPEREADDEEEPEPPKENKPKKNKSEVEDSEVESDSEDENSMERYFNECLEKEKGSSVKTKEMYENFCEWYDKVFDDEDVPDKKEFKQYISDKLGKSVKNTWQNVKISQ